MARPEEMRIDATAAPRHQNFQNADNEPGTAQLEQLPLNCTERMPDGCKLGFA
jgi:hypothetical protein